MWAITESGLNESIKDGEFAPRGYSVVRCDRVDGRKHGGALLIAAPPFRLQPLPLPDTPNLDDAIFEMLCADVYKRNKRLFTCGVVYIPPKSRDNEYMRMFHIIEQCCQKYQNFMILGDFNLCSANIDVQCYYEYFEAVCEFRQYNEIVNCNGRTLDLVLSNLVDYNIIVSEECESLVPKLDPQHPPLSVQFIQNRRHIPGKGNQAAPRSRLPVKGIVNKQGKKWNFYKCDFQALYQSFANVNWSPLYETKGVQEALSLFYEIVNDLISSFTPEKRNDRM